MASAPSWSALGDSSPFRIEPQQLATLRDVIAMLELRIGIETEAAGLAAQRRTAANLAVMRAALDGFAAAVEEGRDAVAADFQFHTEIARATQNEHFSGLLATLGAQIIPRARLDAARRGGPVRARPTCGASTPSTKASTTPSWRRTPKPRARQCARTWRTAASGVAGPLRRPPEGLSLA